MLLNVQRPEIHVGKDRVQNHRMSVVRPCKGCFSDTVPRFCCSIFLYHTRP